jgi:integrase
MKEQFHSVLSDSLASFVRLRRAAGLDYSCQAKLLIYFDRFLVEQGHCQPAISRELIESYQQKISYLCPRGQSNRFSVVRQFCQYIAVRDPSHFVPDSLRFVASKNARVPYIYTSEQIHDLLGAAAQLNPAQSLRPLTYKTLIGLLYTSGIRIGEAMDLNLEDFDPERRRLFIREGKFRKDRWVWLSQSTGDALLTYVTERLGEHGDPPDAPLFINLKKRRLKHPTVWQAFHQLLAACNIVCTPEGGPRIHDLRHTFAVHRLLQWYRAGQNINAKLPGLATHMGHVDIQSTQVYLQATTELIEQVDQRFYTYFTNHVKPQNKTLPRL